MCGASLARLAGVCPRTPDTPPALRLQGRQRRVTSAARRIARHSLTAKPRPHIPCGTLQSSEIFPQLWSRMVGRSGIRTASPCCSLLRDRPLAMR